MKRLVVIVLTLGVMLGVMLAGCGGNSEDKKASSAVSASMTAERCEQNRKAGEITYLTGYDYAAAASIADVVMAKKLGYFDEMCLNVKLQPGFTTANIPLVSENKAQFTGLGSLSEVADANAKGARLVAISALGHTTIEALAVDGGSNIHSPADLKGSTMGVQGVIPFSVRAMLAANGVQTTDLKELQVGYDPTELAKGSFQSRPIYKSNEPRLLDAAKVNYRILDPKDFLTSPGTQEPSEALAATFGVMTVSKTFATAHPTAVEDFLRADLQAYEYAAAHPEETVAELTRLSDPKYFLTSDSETFRWKVETELVASSTPHDKPVGFLDETLSKQEMDVLIHDLKVNITQADAYKTWDSQYFDRIHQDGKLIWSS